MTAEIEVRLLDCAFIRKVNTVIISRVQSSLMLKKSHFVSQFFFPIKNVFLKKIGSSHHLLSNLSKEKSDPLVNDDASSECRQFEFV